MARQEYKGFILLISDTDGEVDIVDSNDELVDGGFKTVEGAKLYIDTGDAEG